MERVVIETDALGVQQAISSSVDDLSAATCCYYRMGGR
ncbi:hypothetical protein ACP4OV_016591 [Aristida adscensionis]